MDAELRQKKLASGKEKLAAFRNKKAKAPKKSNVKNVTNNELYEEDCQHQEAALPDFRSSAKSSLETTPSEALSLSDSELCSLTSDDEHSDEEGRPQIPFTVTELENAMDGQHLISEMIHFGEYSQWTDVSHVESALSQRDELLSQLASSLKLIQELPTQTEDFTTQLYALAQHICLLKTKLNQANQDLQEQLLLHESSMISLQAAKAQILQLQMIVIKKDEQISSMSQAVQLNNDLSIEALKLKDETIHQCQSELRAQSEQLEMFKSELEAKVAECQLWAAAHEEWTSKEENLIFSISSKSEEHIELQKSFQLLKLEETEMLQKCALLQATLAEKDSDDRLQKLEQELVEIRSAHESDTQEIARLQNRNHELESVIDDHSKRLSYYQCLQQDYEHIMNQHSGCLSQLEDLNILNVDLQQRIHSLGQADHDLQVLKQQFEDLRLNYQSEVQKRSELEMKLLDLSNSPEHKTLKSSALSSPSVLSAYFSDLSMNNSSNYPEKEVNLTTVPIPHIHHNVLSGSSCEEVSAPEKSTNGNVFNTKPDSDSLHLVAMIDDLKLKLKISETDCQELAERLKLLEIENSSAQPDVEEKKLNSKEVELLQAEINSLTLQVQTQEAKLSHTTSELAPTLESLHSVQLELTQVKQDESKAKRDPERPVHGDDDAYYLQLVQQQLSEKETAQEELQSQLESTITQWQKLQLIVQEKEIEIQNLQENLDEQKRICSNMSTSHQEYIEVLQSEIDSLKLRLEEYQEKFFNMENEILHLITERNSHQNELERVTANSEIDSQTRLNNHDGSQTVLVDAYIQTDCAGTEVHIDSITSDFNQQTEVVDTNLDSCTDNNIHTSVDHSLQHVTIKELNELIIQKDSVIMSLQAAMSEKEMQIQELEAKVLNIESDLFNAKVSYEDMVKSIQLSEEKLAKKDTDSASASKKATAQQLKLKASKKQVAQKEDIIADLNKKLADSQEQISDLSRQKEDIITDLSKKLADSQEQISDLSRQKEDIVTDLSKKLADSQEQISDLSRQKEDIITDLSKKLADSQEQISDLSRQKEDFVTDLSKKLADSQEQISDLSRQLSERNSELSELLCKVIQKEETQIAVAVENQGTLDLQHESIRLKDDQISNLTEQLLVKNAEITGLHVVLNEKEETLTSLKTLLLEKEELCSAYTKKNSDQEEQLTVIKKELLAKETEITTLNTNVAEKIDVITNLNNALSDNEGQITALKNSLHEKESDLANLQEKVCEQEELIQSLQGQLAARVEEIDRSQIQIRDLEKEFREMLSVSQSHLLEIHNVELSRFQKTITERDEQLSLCNLKLQGSSEEVIRLNGIISEKDQENSITIQQLQAGQSDIFNLNEQLKETAVEISNAAQRQAEKEEEISHLQKELSEKTSELLEIRSKQNEEMANLLEIVHQRDEQLETLQKTLTEKSEYLTILTTKGSETDESILVLKANLIEKEKENSSLLERIADKEEALAKLFQTFNEKTHEIKELSDQLSKQHDSSQNKAGEVSYLNGQLLEKEEALGNLLMTLSVKDDLIVELNGKLSQLKEDIVCIQSTVSENDACIATLTDSLKVKEDESTLLKDKFAEISEIQNKLLETEEKLTQCESEKNDLGVILNQTIEEIAELSKNISEKDKQLLEFNKILEEKADIEKQSLVKDVEMTSLRQHLMEKDEEISRLHKLLVEKDEQIKSSTEVLSKQDISRLLSELTVQSAEYNRKLFDKDEEIGNLLITLSGKDETAFILNSKVNSCNEEILSLHKVITGKDEYCADLNQRLSDQTKEISKWNESLDVIASGESELNRKLNERDEEISGLQLKLSGKDGRILDLDKKLSDLENDKMILQKELEDRLSEMSQTQKDLLDEIVLLKNLTTEKDDQMLNLQRSLDERENGMVQLNKAVADRNMEVTSLSETVSELNNALLKLQKLVDEKDALIMQIQNTLTDQTAEISSLQKYVSDKKDEINDLQKTLENIKEENVRLQMTLNEKTETFAALQTQLKMEATNETELLLNAKDNEISRQAAQISEFQEDISILKKQLEDESFTLSQKEEQMNGMSQKLLEKDELISSKEKEIADLFETINNKEKELFQANQNFVLKVEEIAQMAGVVQEHTEICNGKVKALQQQLFDSELAIDSLKLNLSEGEGILKDTTENLMQRDAEIESLKKELHSKEADYNALHLKLEELTDGNKELKDNIANLKQELSDCMIVMNDKDTKLTEALNTLSLRDAELEFSKKDLQSKETDYNALQLKLEELTDSNKELNDNIANLKQELSDCMIVMNDKDTKLTEALNTLSLRDAESEFSKKDLQSKETDYNALQLKLQELTDSNKELNDNIASLKQELSDSMIVMNDKDTKLKETLNTLVEQEKLISQLEPEKTYFNEQLVQHEIVTSELQDKIVMLESELNQQKAYHHEVVDSLNAQHSVLSDEMGILKVAHEKKEMEYSQIEQERHQSCSKIIELEAEIHRLLKNLEESTLEKQTFREGNVQLLSVKENLLESLDDFQQKIEQRDLEILEISSRLAQEQESCKQLMKSNNDLEKSYILLQSSFSNLLEKSEDNQSVLIQQEIKLQEQESTIDSLLSNRTDHVQESSPDISKEMTPASDIDEPDNKRDILVDPPGTIKNLKLSYQLLMNQFLILSEDSQQKDELLIGQRLELEHKSLALQDLSVKLEETNTALSESLHCTASLRTEVNTLKAQCHALMDNEHTLKHKISSLEAQVESQEIISSHHVAECNRLAEHVAQLSQDLEIKEKLLDEIKHESGSYLKELNDLKAELESKSITENSLKETVDSLTSSLNKSQEERELLKANFDSCMEDMQQKLTQQELETQRLRSKLAEQTKTVCQGQDQLKDIFELQVCQLEEKLLQSEKQCEQLAKDLADSKTKYTTCKDLYEGQLSDLEISLQSANSEVAKLRDQLSKIMNNHECEVAGLKRLHEIQTNELEDSCLALERNVSELRRQINEQTMKFNKERNNLEQSIEFQLSDSEEKRRVHEAEVSRLRRHLEEMKQDHEMEMRNLEKSCEARMYELEDKCCIATGELERLRKSFSTDGEYSEERHRLDLRIDELETKRRDLEIHNRDLEEEVHHLREQLMMREDELKSLLHSMAEKVDEKGTETAEEIVLLRHKLTDMSHEKNQALDSLQSRKTDLDKSLARNEDLRLKIAELEQLVEQLVRVRKDEDGKDKSGLENLQSQINTLSEENSSLKRQLSVKAISRQSLSLKPGVEAICPPYSHVSTHYSSSTVDECFSPVVEPEVLEGFVAENSNQAKRESQSNMNNNSLINQEPDFVEEQNDRFQPEMEQEREMDSTNQLNMHPIWENEIHEGFEPETSDLFLVEPAEESSQSIVWPRELSVGMSPSHHKPAELQFDFNLGGESVPHAHRAEVEASGANAVSDTTPSSGTSLSIDMIPNKSTKPSNDMTLSTATDLEESVSKKQMKELKEHLEEQYVLKMRTQEATLMCEYAAQHEKYKKEMESHFAQKVQAVRYEWERKFTKALRQLKRDMERKSKEQHLRASATDTTDASHGGRLNDRPDIAERNMELGEQVEKLHKENQELAEVRDDLLRQIEISQARGLHVRVQHELQTMLTTRDMHPSSPTSLTPTPMSPTGDYEESPTLVDQSMEEADGSRSEVSESSSIRECFLEELEEISHQSGQDLPLEWELTCTETGVFEQEPASIWEVFDGRCARQDCQEVDSLRIQYGHQVASLQRQLEEERRCSQEQLAKRQDEYDQAVSELRAKLDIELQDSLDQIMEELSQLHSQEVKHLLTTHQDELTLELTALKISMEQIYASKAQLEASQQQEIFQQKMETIERRHKEEMSRGKNNMGVPETLEHLSETLTDDYNKLIQRISHELETKFASESGDSGFSSHTSQELCSLLLSQQEEITVLRSKLLTEYSSLLQSRVETMTEQAEEVNQLEDQMKDIKKQCDRQMVHLQESINSQQEYESKESEDEDKRLKENIDQLKEHYEIVIENMESEFNAKIRALQDKYEEQLSTLIPFSTSHHNDLDSQAGSRHPINSRDNSVESGSFSESVEKDMADQMKKLEAELLEREAAQQRLKNDLVNEQLRCKTMEAEISQLKEALDSLKAEHETTISCVSGLENLVQEREERIVQLEKEKVESEKLYRDLLEKESSSKETKDLAGVSMHGSVHTAQGDRLLASSDDDYNSSSSGNIESLEKHMEELEHQLAVARGREQELRHQMEEKEHAYKETLESLKLELEHEKQVEIETLQSEFKVQLGVELKHQAAEMASKLSEVDQQKVVMTSSDSDQNPEESINVSDKERTKEISELEEELETLKKQLMESEDRYDSLMKGIQSGEHAEFNQLFQDKYDTQLELVKSYMQKDFDELLQQEKKNVVEKHRKLMIEMMGDRSEEETALQEKHKAELEDLRQELSAQFQEERDRYTQEISRLNHELEELNASHSSKSDQVDSKHLTLPEINEIILDFQEVGESTSSPEGSRGGNSAPEVLNDSNDSLAAMQMTEESAPQQAELNFGADVAVRTFAEVLKSPPPLSTSERQEMTNKIQQLTSQVECLNHQVTELQRPTPVSENSLSCTMDTLQGDESALIAMLKSDLDRISIERESIQRTNDRLLSLLSDSVKTYIGVEDTISRRLSQNGMFNSLSSGAEGAAALSLSPRPGMYGVSQSRESSPETCRVEKRGDADTSQDSHSVENTSFQSNGIDEGLEISQRLAECIFVGPDLDAEGEEILSDARGRLQNSISQLLELMERSCLQLQEAKSTQHDLLETLASRSREVESLNTKCHELNSQISSEIEAKEYLGLELHKAEGLIAGYISEHDSMESQIQSLEQQRESMILELDTTRSRLEQFEQSRSELDSFRDELHHQRQVLEDNAGQEIQVDESLSIQAAGEGNPALLGEITSLNKDKRELANQLQQQLDSTRKRLLELETQLEESERQHDAALEEKLHEIEDLNLQLENVERQLKASKSFVDEQMSEREQEREEHQREIEKLQEMLEAKDRQFNSQQRLQIEIADLTEQLQSRMTSQSGMHQHIMDLQKALQDKELSAHDLKIWVAQLEKELDQRGDIEEQLKLRISRLEQQLSFKKDDSILDSAESSLRDTEKEKSPPLILSPVQTQRLTSVSLEEELRRCQEYEQELVHENKALKEQVQVQLLQISGLRNQLDELRQYSGMDADSDSSHLRVKLQASRDTVEKLEEKLGESQNKIESLEMMIRVKAEETDQIKAKVSRILDMGDTAEENEHLKSQLEDLQNQISHLSSISSLSSLPPELLEEKNNEIQELREKLARLEKELSETQEEGSLTKEKICELQARLKEKDEEINDLQDNIASLRRGEPFLDMSLPMNEEANHLLNISMTGRISKSVADKELTSMHQEFEETILNKEAELNAVQEKMLHISKDMEKKNQELETLRKMVSELQAEKDHLASLEETVEKKDSEIYSLTLNAEEMKQQNQEYTETIEILEQEIQKWEKQLSDVVEERDKYHSEVTEKDLKMDQMQIQIDNFQQEISSLTNFQQELQKDFDTVHSMLDGKEREIEALTHELTDNKSQSETLEAMLQLEQAVARLQKEVKEKHNVIEEKEEHIYELQDKLEEMVEKRNEEVSSLKQQLTETEEQLRLRQTAVLDMQADKENLLVSVEDLKDLQNKVEERDAAIEELESQLRFRQLRILDIEAEVERMAEEKELLEANMKERLQEKDNEIDRLEKLNRSESAGNHEDLMQKTQVVCNQGEQSGDQGNETLLNSKQTNETITMTVKEMGEKSSIAVLVEKDKEIEKLQVEIQALHQEAANCQQLEMQVKELQELLQEQEETTQSQITEYQAVIFKLQKEAPDLRASVNSRHQMETRVSRSANLSLTSSLDGDAAAGGMTRWDSEPAGLAQSSMDSIHLRLNVSEAARMTRQQQRELHQKNYELENLRQNLERWLKMKDEGPMNELVKEKETLIISLRSEIETIREEVSEKETVISSLRDELEAIKSVHVQELSSKDHQITQLQEEIYLVKSVRAHSNNNTGDQSLSPETKQSISHLKLQLRKAHAALEEMQGVQMMSDGDGDRSVGDGAALDKVKLGEEVEKLKEMLRAKEEEWDLYKTTSQIEQDEAMKKCLEEQRERLEENHRQELQDLMSEYEEQMDVIREEKSDSNVDKEKAQKSTTVSLSLDDTMPERLQLLLQQLNELGEHFLSVSDLQYLQQYLALHKQQSGLYDSVSKQDLQEFDDTVEAMKNLFNTVENLVSTQATEDSHDWRAEVLMALSHVYMKEKDLILAEVNATSPELDLVTRLDSRLQHLAELQESNMEIMVQADRKSLVSELNCLKRELLDSKIRLQNVKDELGQQVSNLEENKSKLEWKLQRQVQMLECKLQQETVIQDDLKKSLKLERQRLSELTLQSTHDKAHLLELQSELSSTQIQLSKARDSLQREQQRFTSVTDALEEENDKNIRLSELLEATKKSLESLREEVTESDLERHRKSQSEDNYIQKLQEELIKERQRCYQFSQAEDEAKRELTELANEKTIIQRQLSGLQKDFDVHVETLHREQEERESNLQTVMSLKEMLASERQLHRTALEKEKASSTELRNEIEIMKSRLKQVDTESDQTDRGSNLKQQQHADRNGATERKVHVHLKLVEEDREKLRVKVNDLEHELGRIQGKMEELETELEHARKTRESHNHLELHSDSVSQSDGGIYREIANDNLEERLSDCCLKLQSVAHQLDKMTMTSHQTSGSFAQDQSTLVSVMSELKQLRGEIKDIGTTVPETASNAEQINRLLEHNKQLGDHIKQLKLEKKELVSSLQDIRSKLQDTKRTQVQLPQYLSDSASEDGVYDRTVWASERLGLQMALDSAEHEIQRLRSEIQQFRAKIQSDVANTDVDKTSRLYGKYLRAESFRKALIYQKKYLLLLLGGYRDTEQETLAILASMGGFPHPYSSTYRKTRSKAFTKFRSVGRVIIAVSRMKYMVRKWKRATRVGSPVMSGQVSPHISYVPSSSSYPKHKRQPTHADQRQATHSDLRQLTHSDQRHTTHSDQRQRTHSDQQCASRDLYRADAYYKNTDDYLVANGGMTTSTTTRSHTPITTPPTKDLTRLHRPSSKSAGVEKIRRDIFAVENSSSPRHTAHNGSHTHHASDGDDFLLYLQNIHKQLSEGEFGSGRELL